MPEEEAPCLPQLSTDQHSYLENFIFKREEKQLSYTLEECKLNFSEGCFLPSLLNLVKKSMSLATVCLSNIQLLTRNTSDVTANEASFGIIP